MDPSHIPSSKLATGGAVITAGLVWLFGTLTIGVLLSLVDTWPLVVVIVGLAQILEPGSYCSGIRLIGIGALCQIMNLGLFGIEWSNGWPALLIFIGAGLASSALSERSGGQWQPGETHGQ